MAEMGKNIQTAADWLMADEVVAIPTETVYGLAGNALSENAIRKIFAVKNRPLSDPLIVHFPSLEAVKHYVAQIPDVAGSLMEHFWPGPLTILLPKSDIIPNLVTNGSPLVAVRVPNHTLTLALLKELPFPLVAPSANPFGRISPTDPKHVQEFLGDKIPFILDGGPCTVGLESTIVKITDGGKIQILRQGGISEETLAAFAELIEIEGAKQDVVPGSMLSHYAPTKRLVIGPIEKYIQEWEPEKVGYLGWNKEVPSLPKKNQVILSRTENLAEAARNLFSAMHQLDKLDIKIIVADTFPNHGLGKAINDRLRRAAAKS